MTKQDTHIRNCQNQVIHFLTENPSKSLCTSEIAAQVNDGLLCHVVQGAHEVAMDMGTAMGGDASAPTPGFYTKAGIVGCIAIATKMTAAREGLVVHSVKVDMQTDTDTLAIFRQGGGNAAPLETRINIEIDSEEHDATISDLVAHVLSIDTWFLALRDSQAVSVDWKRMESVAA